MPNPYKSPRDLIRTIPDFPKTGIRFRDIMPLLADAEAFNDVIEAMATKIDSYQVAPTLFVGLEARGFIFAAALARAYGTGVIPLRKPGKLPGKVISVGYNLEYGNDKLEMQDDALENGNSSRIVIVDDVLATGGTALAALELMKLKGGRVICCSFLMELAGLNGRARLHKNNFVDVEALYEFGGDE